MSAPNSNSPAKETVTANMSRWASALQYKDLSPEAVYQALDRFARTAMDALGIGSFWLERPGEAPSTEADPPPRMDITPARP